MQYEFFKNAFFDTEQEEDDELSNFFRIGFSGPHIRPNFNEEYNFNGNSNSIRGQFIQDSQIPNEEIEINLRDDKIYDV